MNPLGGGRTIGGVLGRAQGAAGVPWYLAGGVTPIAAYSPKGAASLAASYTNLANPGTYDAAPGIAPTFDTLTGWTFAAASAQYLTTGVTPSTGWSALVKFADASASTINFLFGSQGTGAASNYLFGVWPVTSGGVRAYHNSGNLNKSDSVTSGVLGFAGQTAYRDGSAETGTIATRAGSLWRSIYIGARNNGAAEFFVTAKISSLIFFDTTLTAPQMATQTAAMP